MKTYRLLRTIALTLALTFVTACASDRPRVVLVPPIVTDPVTLEPSDIIKLGPDIRGPVYIQTENGWELSDNELDLPEGWFLIPPPTQPKEK